MSIIYMIVRNHVLNVCRYILRREASQNKGLRTSKQLADLQDKQNALYCLIQNLHEVQLVYTPHVATLISETQPPPEATNTRPYASLPSEVLVKNIPLFLPSSLPSHIRALPELKEICNLERHLGEPQADDALAEIRHQRRVIQGLWLFKRLNVSGTGNRPNTRMITLYKRFSNKMDRAAQKYRVAWRALCILDPSGSWSERLKDLKSKDVSGPGRDPDDSTASNSRYEPSWIWLVWHSSSSGSEMHIGEDEFNESMHVEWAKARARMMRWKEELMLVQEEMRRVVAYHKWKADWWRERGSTRHHADQVISSGISGYAYKQADISMHMAEQCALHWLPHLKLQGIMLPWGVAYEHLLVKPRGLTGGPDEVLGDATGDIDYVEDLDDNGNETEGEDEHEADEDDYFELDDNLLVMFLSVQLYFFLISFLPSH